MKKLMVIFAALFILAGGTVAGLKWLGIGPFENTETVQEEAPQEPKEKTIFIDMDAIMVPLLQGNSVAATVQIQVKLETEGKENAIFLKRRMPRISDAFVRDLHAFLPRMLKETERIDVLILKQRLQVIGDRLFGKGYINDVLVQSVIDTPGR